MCCCSPAAGICVCNRHVCTTPHEVQHVATYAHLHCALLMVRSSCLPRLFVKLTVSNAPRDPGDQSTAATDATYGTNPV